jgi:hypothetical protein
MSRSSESDLGGVSGLSVVVPSVNRFETLSRTLAALEAQEGGVALEVVVPERTGATTRSQVRRRFPRAIVIPVEPGTPIPAMRRVAFEASSAPVVAVIEDHVIVPPDWAARLRGAVSEEQPIVGGWVRNAATDRLIDRAAYLCEYGHMLSPLPSGPAEWLTGNNVAYHRSVLQRFGDVIDEDRWENRLHDAAREAGVPLQRRTDIEVGHAMHYQSAVEYAAQRFLYSRAYAGMRLAGVGRARSLIYGLAAMALPPILLARIVKNGWGMPEARADLAKSLPMLSLFVVAWALGEVVGAWVGPGDALGRVR